MIRTPSSARLRIAILASLPASLFTLVLSEAPASAAGVEECRAAAVRVAGNFTKKRTRHFLKCQADGGCDAATLEAKIRRARRRGFALLRAACTGVEPSSLGFGPVCSEPSGRCNQPIDSDDALVACLLCSVAETIEPLIRRLDGEPAGVTESCGGCAASECKPNAYCEPPPGVCGSTPEVGTCAEVPQACPESFDPVCGCDGVTYDNDCFRRQGRTGLSHPGPCQSECTDAAGDGCPGGTFCDGLPGRCDAPPDGTCVPIPTGCPDNVDPVCGCDGATYSNDCDRRAAGVRLDHRGACITACGFDPTVPEVGTVCPDGSFCERPPGLCDLVPAPIPGHCVPKPEACPEIFAPVCGCDGVTYGNDCERRAAGVDKQHDGECEPKCGGIIGAPCEDGGLCELPPGQCSTADLQGHCVERPEACIQIFDPVCGCDGRTYGNDCERRAAGAQLAHYGPCPRDCGPDRPSCDEGEVCLPPPGSCDAAEGGGSCFPISDTCPLAVDAPFPILAVCGCDDRTYDSACEAIRAGVQVAYSGPCAPFESQPEPPPASDSP